MVTTPPKPPATIDGIERFIALAIRFVRIVPEAPTIMPATISAVLFSAMPVAAALRPVNALSSEITTGMSAPPIGSTTKLPSTAAASSSTMMRPSASEPATIATAQATATSSSTRLSTCCVRPGPKLIGRPGRISWSLPKAMFEPQKDTEPTIAANRLKIATYVGSTAKPSVWRNSTQAISATAPPPTPLNSATICGIAVIFTWRAAGTPTAVPIATPRTIRPQLPIAGDEQGGDDRDRHADRRDAVAAHRRRGPVSPLSP